MPHPDFAQTLSKDRHFLRSAFKNPNKYGGLAKVEEKYKKSHDLYLKRLSKLLKPEFDNTLPVHEKLDEIKKAIAENQVTIICGETGSSLVLTAKSFPCKAIWKVRSAVCRQRNLILTV